MTQLNLSLEEIQAARAALSPLLSPDAIDPAVARLYHKLTDAERVARAARAASQERTLALMARDGARECAEAAEAKARECAGSPSEAALWLREAAAAREAEAAAEARYARALRPL